MDWITLTIFALIAAAAFVIGRYWRRGMTEGDELITHVFIGSHETNEAWRRAALAKAKSKYGRPFKCANDILGYEKVHRGMPRSRTLQEFDEISRTAREGEKLERTIDNITRIERKAK